MLFSGISCKQVVAGDDTFLPLLEMREPATMLLYLVLRFEFPSFSSHIIHKKSIVNYIFSIFFQGKKGHGTWNSVAKRGCYYHWP